MWKEQEKNKKLRDEQLSNEEYISTLREEAQLYTDSENNLKKEH